MAVEFLLATLLVILPLAIGTLEIARLSVMRQWLVLATAEGARHAAVDSGSVAGFRRGFLRVRAGLHRSVEIGAPDVLRPPAVEEVGRALAAASAHLGRADRLRIERRLQSPQELQALARAASLEDRLPAHAQAWPRALGAAEARRWIEALRIEWRVTSCEQPLWPALLGPALRPWQSISVDPFVRACLAAGRVPIAARVTEATHSDLRF